MQFVFLLMPATVPLAIASYSIVGEKQTRSLEAVLATPIRTTELLAGKAVAALVPGILAAWAAYAVMVALGPHAIGAMGNSDELMGRVAGRFARVESRRRGRDLVLGLASELPRKNCWSIAEHAGDAAPDGMQHLLARAR